MFSRLQDYRDRRNRRFAEAREEGKAEGREEGKTEGIEQGLEQGKAEAEAQIYREIAAWDSRRKAAEARGEPFTEPPPGMTQNHSENYGKP